ncbi:MAG: hypothetical protein CR984_05915 [Proteobacteria bacterium]|nr:MAG: hypothetical protein CR984_05915 [Pseudomonadota bacterium]PIE67875.1 MAG: hypothetical protein CSA23_01765 [Deltaproteobacteria bacterium]
MGGGTVELSIQGKMDTVFVFDLKDIEIHGHGTPPFPPLNSGMIHSPAAGLTGGWQIVILEKESGGAARIFQQEH